MRDPQKPKGLKMEWGIWGKLASILTGKNNNAEALKTIQTGVGLANSAKQMYKPITTGSEQ